MTDADLLALCGFEEANLEPDDGVAAVIRVILNRLKLRYQSDGTVFGTVTHGNGVAFSWVGFAMLDGHYTRVANGPSQIVSRISMLLEQAQGYTKAWARALDIAGRVQAGTYEGPDYAHLTDDTVMYLNPAIASAAWASPAAFVTQIGHHSFYRAA